MQCGQVESQVGTANARTAWIYVKDELQLHDIGLCKTTFVSSIAHMHCEETSLASHLDFPERPPLFDKGHQDCLRIRADTTMDRICRSIHRCWCALTVAITIAMAFLKRNWLGSCPGN